MNTNVILSDFGLRHHIFRSYRNEPVEVFMTVEEPFEFIDYIVDTFYRDCTEVYITSFVEKVFVTYRGHKRLVKRVTYIFKYPDSCLDCKFMYYLL